MTPVAFCRSRELHRHHSNPQLHLPVAFEPSQTQASPFPQQPFSSTLPSPTIPFCQSRSSSEVGPAPSARTRAVGTEEKRPWRVAKAYQASSGMLPGCGVKAKMPRSPQPACRTMKQQMDKENHLPLLPYWPAIGRERRSAPNSRSGERLRFRTADLAGQNSSRHQAVLKFLYYQRLRQDGET